MQNLKNIISFVTWNNKVNSFVCLSHVFVCVFCVVVVVVVLAIIDVVIVVDRVIQLVVVLLSLCGRLCVCACVSVCLLINRGSWFILMELHTQSMNA